MITSMNSRARTVAAVNNEQPDRTPMDFGGTPLAGCNSEFLKQIRREFGFSLPDDRDLDGSWVDEQIQRELGVDLRLVPSEPPLAILKEIDPPTYEAAVEARRERETRTDESIKTPNVPREFPLANATLREIREMRPGRPSPPKHLEWMLETAKAYRAQGYATSCWLDCGFFETACWLRGYEQTAIDLIAEPDIVRALCDVWLEEKLHRIEVTARPLAPYIDLFCFGDDLATQKDLFMSPETFRDVLKPYYVTQYGRLHEVAPDSYIHHHSCGAVSKLIEDFIDIGIDVLNPIQPNAAGMEPQRLKQLGAGRLCYHGGIDLQWLLPFGNPEEVAEEAEKRMAILGDGGGYICAAAHSLPDDVPVANIIALFSARRPG